ncbi:hypothetical protein ACWT_1468 [Actinoplanes sp. SE50]|uniref:hypothetical protein n=1 Tax=unclassified Actinoplanes TaxID=2626549 RepID=UPI00023EC3FD|nr:MULTISPECIES: hypothetical protein [unclassified Actinoplanes]AEV82486.1 hypothetical protein ACPL_1589 [Actinoplanes sp. SE50/110]ATO80883.1 hypothetical protein ACWT_1468 [Actinoplanes sp. SE50]SLL98290.1 hypothetical protein ACSP50_1516 [Actinoplanes sp. SE50/110]
MTPDPARHWLSYPVHRGDPEGFRPKPLDEFAADARPALDAGDAFDHRTTRGSRDIVSISVQRAGVIAALLDELALRLRPGVEAGPIQADGELSLLARELADDMYRWASPE